MHQVCFLIPLLALVAAPLQAQTVTVDPLNQTLTAQMQVVPPHIGGRVQANPPDGTMLSGAVSYTHQWPGIYFEAGFEGSEVVLKFNDAVNEYRLLIDDLAPIPLAQPGAVEMTVSDLSQGHHLLRLEKVTESIWMLGAFEGVYLGPQAKPLAVAPKARQIEFIGDSDMTGYGVRSSTTTCTQEEVRLTSDTQAAYPALVAKHFDADYQINAISGRGIVRNYDGMVPDHTIASLYDSILPDQTEIDAPYTDPNWQPQIILVGLGNNDFATPLHPEEPWKTNDALIDSYIAGMAAFLETLHAHSPSAAILIYWPDQGIMTDVEKVRLDREGKSALIQTARSQGIKQLEFVAPGDLGLAAAACHAHASIDDHRKKAAWMIDRIAQQPGLWGGQQ